MQEGPRDERNAGSFSKNQFPTEPVNHSNRNHPAHSGATKEPAHHGRTPKDFSLEFVLNRQATGPCPNVASVFREGVGGVGFLMDG